MANVIIKSDKQKSTEANVLKSFGHNPERANKAQREQAETIVRRSAEAKKER